MEASPEVPLSVLKREVGRQRELRPRDLRRASQEGVEGGRGGGHRVGSVCVGVCVCLSAYLILFCAWRVTIFLIPTCHLIF